MKPSNESALRNEEDEELLPFPGEEIAQGISQHIFQEDINLYGGLLSQSEAREPEDMIRPDLPTEKSVPAGERFDPEFWTGLMGSEIIQEPSLALGAEITGTGEVRAQVSEVAGQCEQAPLHQYWHVAHGKAGLGLSLQFYGVPGGAETEEFLVRAVLFRKQSEYKRFPVNAVCPRHQEDWPEPGLTEHVVRARPGEGGDTAVYSTPEEGPRRSVSFPCQGPDTSGEIRKEISLLFCCHSSCDTTKTKDPTYQNREASQDLTLVLTLESRQNLREPCRVLARTSVDVWPKKTVNSRDLNKPQRMLPKGGRAQKRNFQDELDNFGKKLAGEAKRRKFTLSQVLKSVRNNW